MSEPVFPRRVFLKSSAIAATALALSSCGGGEEYASSIFGVGCSVVEAVGPFFHSDMPDTVEFRFKISNEDDSTITLNANSIISKFDEQPVALSEKKLTNSKLAYLLDEMPISGIQTVSGYLLLQGKKSTKYQITFTLQRDNGTEEAYTFDFDFSPNWYE